MERLAVIRQTADDLRLVHSQSCVTGGRHGAHLVNLSA